MAFAYSGPGFSSELCAAEMYYSIGEDLQQLHSAVRIAFVAPTPDAPSISYALEALAQGASPGLEPEIWMPDPDGTYQNVQSLDEMRRVRDMGLYAPASAETTGELLNALQDRKNSASDEIHGIVPLTNIDLFTHKIDPELDLDGVSSNAKYTPATPEGMARVADYILRTMGRSIRNLDPTQIVVLGNGGVGGPLVEKVLPGYGIRLPADNHFKAREDLEKGSDRLATDPNIALGFTATRAAGGIRSLTPDTLLIDVGYATDPTTGAEMGNAHPDLVAQNGKNGIRINSFRSGCGPITIAIIYERAVAAKLARVHGRVLASVS